MTTFTELVDEVQEKLNGFTLRQERTAVLQSQILSTDNTLVLDSVDNIGKGIIEIDDELIYISSFSRASNTANVAGVTGNFWGRGYNNTTPATHVAGSKVTVSPLFPRKAVKRAINDAINQVWPALYGVGVTTFSYNSAKDTYELPTAVENILAITWQRLGSSGTWSEVKRYSVDMNANTTTYPSGVTVTLWGPDAGRTVNVKYSKKPTELANDSDVFATVTGLPASSRDVIVLGAVVQLLSFVDPARLNFTSPEADENDRTRAFGSGTTLTRNMLALYERRLGEERAKLQDMYPIKMHYTTL